MPNLEEIIESDDIPHLRSPRLINRTFEEDEILLIPLGDIHIGSSECDEKLLKETLEWIEKKPNTYMVGMGDYMENATRDSVSDIYSQTTPPMEQMYKLRDMLLPLAKKGKILGLLRGNHEIRTYKAMGFEPTVMLCDLLDVPYMGDAQFIKLRVGKQNYHIYAIHGASSAWTSGGKLNSLMRMAQVADADIYLMGHVHELASHSRPMLRIDNRNKTIVQRKQYFVLTGHFLDYMDSYAQRRTYPIGKKGVARIELSGDKWDTHVST